MMSRIFCEMKFIPLVALVAPVALVALVAAVVLGREARGDTVVGFEDLPDLPEVDSFRSLSDANSGTSSYANVIWDSDFVVVGDNYVEAFHNQGGVAPFATPQSGDYAVFNRSGRNRLTFTTGRRLVGLWVSRADLGTGPRGTTQVTIHALNGVDLVASETIDLLQTGTVPAFLDTSSFLSLSSVDGYRIDRVVSGDDPYGGLHYILDDLTFAKEPSPGDLDFDSRVLAPPEEVVAMASNGSVGIGWDEVEGAAFYDIYWSSQQEFDLDSETVNRISFVLPGFIHDGLTDGQEHFYVVVARDEAGNGSRSVEVSATPGEILGSHPTDVIISFHRGRWEYLHPTDRIDPATSDLDFAATWHTPSTYDGPDFSRGRGLMGYGAIDFRPISTNIGTPPEGARYSSYFRTDRLMTSEAYAFLAFEVLADDGGVLYIDGERSATVNFSGEDNYTALTDRVGSESVRRVILLEQMLETGEHTIAFSLHNVATDSSDLGFEMEMLGGSDHLDYIGWNLIEGSLDVAISSIHPHIVGNLPIPGSISGRPVVRIGEAAFEDCRFATISLPDTVTTMGNDVFRNCTRLTTVTLPPHLTEIRVGAFAGCSELREISIPEGVSAIGPIAFQHCSNLESISFLGSAPEIVHNSTFSSVAEGARAYVRLEHADSFGGLGADWHGLTVTAFPTRITSLEVFGNQISIAFSGETAASGWMIKGTTDLSEFTDDLTPQSTVEETSAGNYSAVIEFESLPHSYFLRVER